MLEHLEAYDQIERETGPVGEKVRLHAFDAALMRNRIDVQGYAALEPVQLAKHPGVVRAHV